MTGNWLALLGPKIKPALLPYWLFSRGMTLGVRCAAFDAQGRICLVKHTYAQGWHFPGGGVERGETMYEAIEKELREEAGITPREVPALFGVYANLALARRDHVVLFVSRNWSQTAIKLPSREIARIELFDLASLPNDTTHATRRRIDEIEQGLAPNPNW